MCPLVPYIAADGTTTARRVALCGGPPHRSPAGLPLVGRAGPHDAQDGDEEQDGEGHIRADEGDGEDGGHDVEGGRGGMGQRGEDGGDGAGEGAEHEGGEAKCPDVRAGLSVGRASPPAV